MLATLTTSCATTDYARPIQELHTALESAVTTIDELDSAATANRNARVRNAIAGGDVLLDEEAGQCALGAAACTLVIVYSDDTPTHAYPVRSLIPQARTGLEELRRYVDRLKSIVEADTTAQVRAAGSAALGSAQQIEDAVAKARNQESGNTIANLKEPSVATVTWLVGQYVAKAKRRTLAASMDAAHPMIDDLTQYHAALAAAFAALETSRAAREFLGTQARFDDLADTDKLTVQDVDTYVAAAESYNVALSASTVAPLKAFAISHASLSDHLNGRSDVTLAEAYAALEAFVQEAITFRSLLQQFRDALDNQPEDQNVQHQ